MPELEEVKEIPKKTFMQKPNSNQEKIEREEEELKELLSEQDNVKEEGQQVEKTTKSSEEKTFKKRYGDLRRHSQNQADDLQAKIKQLEKQLDVSTKESIKVRSSFLGFDFISSIKFMVRHHYGKADILLQL